MKSFHLTLSFYRSFYIASISINILGLMLFSLYGDGVVPAFIAFKIFTNTLIYLYINKSKQNEYPYYQNLGLQKNKVWLLSLGLDTILLLLTLKATKVF